jgi:hypothetical protein
LGNLLVRRLSDIALERGMNQLWGVISPDNTLMLNLSRKYQAELIPREDGNYTAIITIKGDAPTGERLRA